MRGRLVLVVGPSGAGKDTLINGARAALAHDDRFVFVRRVVTRLADGTEDHDSVSEDAFVRRDAAGEFALSWRAHGLWYGLPSALVQDIAAGRIATANVSRAVVDAAVAKYPGSVVIAIDAPVEVRARRLAGRGRESEAEIGARLAREAVSFEAPAITVDNSSDREAGTTRFVARLRGIADE